jgi:hypothetical protein
MVRMHKSLNVAERTDNIDELYKQSIANVQNKNRKMLTECSHKQLFIRNASFCKRSM